MITQDTHHHILQRVNAGDITPDEAEQLLNALESSDAPKSPTHAIQTVTVAEDAPNYPAKPKRNPEDDLSPDMRQFRRCWEYPFIGGIVLLALAGMFASNTSSLLLQLCGWSVFALAALIALIGWVSQWSPWIHIRIKERKGSRIAFSLPLPLSLLTGLLNLTRPFVRRFAPDDDAAFYLDIATGLLSAVDSGLLADQPITIDVNEPDGDQVQVFIG